MTSSQDYRWPPSCFRRDGAVFVPYPLVRSPWDPNAIAGGPISGLLATAVEDLIPRDGFEVARYSLDILGKVPLLPLTARARVLRHGRQMRLHLIELLAAEKPVAQVMVLLVRQTETPHFPVPHAYPAPHDVPVEEWIPRASMKGSIRMRPIYGNAGVPGRGTGWLAMECEIVEGEAPSNFVKAAYLADYGGGIGCATVAAEWSYANLDISLQFLRMPVGEWLLIDAETFMAGNGHGSAFSTFADSAGIYARGVQTIFVAPATQQR